MGKLKDPWSWLLGIMLLTCCAYYSSKIGYRHNEGVSLFCSMVGWDLYLSGKPSILGCTYDHQPLFTFLLYPFHYFNVTSAFLWRLPSIICHVLATVLVFNVFFRDWKKWIAFLFCLVVSIHPTLIDLMVQIRMYGPYELGSLMLYLEFTRIRQGDKERASAFFFHSIWLSVTFIFCYFIIIPMTGLIYRQTTKKVFWGGVIVLSMILIYKLDAILAHRLISRTSEMEQFNMGKIRMDLLSAFMLSNVFATFTQGILFLLGLFSLFKKRKAFELLLIFGSIGFLFLTRGVLKMEEIDLRYFIFCGIFLIKGLAELMPLRVVVICLVLVCATGFRSTIFVNNKFDHFYITAKMKPLMQKLALHEELPLYSNDAYMIQNYWMVYNKLENKEELQKIQYLWEYGVTPGDKFILLWQGKDSIDFIEGWVKLHTGEDYKLEPLYDEFYGHMGNNLQAFLVTAPEQE
jgi:hypothetical protein